MDPGAYDTETEEGLIGFFGRDGKWITITELEEHGPDVDTPARELVEELVEIDMLRVTRNDDGEPVAAQLTPFAADLYDAEGTDGAIAVYMEYGKEPPEDLQEEYLEELHALQEEKRLSGGTQRE